MIIIANAANKVITSSTTPNNDNAKIIKKNPKAAPYGSFLLPRIVLNALAGANPAPIIIKPSVNIHNNNAMVLVMKSNAQNSTQIPNEMNTAPYAP